jgi:DNA-binding CsgD family transcriptional regulator/tetratricopeptide (TPR) repeat protein
MVADRPKRLGMPDRISPVLIGREEALELGLRRWGSAREGHGELLLVAGESGIGKTRLMAEVAARTHALSPRAAAYPREMDAPGAIIYNLADELRRIGLPVPAQQLRQRLDDEGATSGDSARRRRLLLGDISQVITDTLAETPMLLRLEDLHWADELSLDVLERVAATLDSVPSLVLGTYRSDELFAGSRLRTWRARLLEQRLAEEVRLPRLDREAIAQMVEAITGSFASTELVTSLLRRSDGIPLHIEELLAADPDSAVLETVGEVIVARLARLGTADRKIVSAASVIGRAFDVRILQAITSQTGDAVAAALREASALHIVVRQHDDSFGFRHSIVCDVTYSEIPAARRAAMHAAVASAAARAGIGDAYVSEHFERAGESELAHEYALTAAADAVRVSAHREAAGLYARAERTMSSSASPEHRADVNARLAEELAAIDDIDPAARHLEFAIETYRNLGREIDAVRLVPRLMAARHQLGTNLDQRSALALEALERLGDAAGADASAARAGLLAALCAAHMLDRRLEQSLEYGERAIALLDESDAMAIDIRLSLGSSLLFSGRGDEGWPMLEQAIRRAQDANLEEVASRGFRMIGTSASVLLEYDRAAKWIVEGLEYTAKVERWSDHHYLDSHRAHVFWATGDWSSADRTARRALANGAGITTRITALIVLGYVCLARGDVDSAGAHLTEARGLGERMHELQRESPAMWGLAELALWEERPARAVEFCERGYRESERVGDAAYLFPYVITGTRAHLAQRQLGEAREWIERCASLIGSRAIPGTGSAVDHARGLLELAEGHLSAARTLLETASDGWIARQRRWESVQALVDLARCARRSKRPTDASRLIGRARDAAKGAPLLEALATPDSDEQSGLLSAREFEVARLVAQGATNREIATRLVISPKTASTHIEHILAKLGVGRRAEIAAWVTSTGGVDSPRR